MIRWLGSRLSHASERWVPDPFAIAIVLTLATGLLCWWQADVGPLELIGLWGGRVR